jgi:hypothetical protein
MNRTRRILSGCIGAVMVALFIYVGVRFPDAPIHKCRAGTAYAITQHPSGYCGKQGQPHTENDYHAYEFWEMVLFIVWPAGMASIAALRYLRRQPYQTVQNSN